MLQIGGSVYTTSTQTLRRYPDSLLGLMFSGRHELRPEADGKPDLSMGPFCVT